MLMRLKWPEKWPLRYWKGLPDYFMSSKFLTFLFILLGNSPLLYAAQEHELHGNASPDIHLLYKVINFALLIAGLVYLLKKPLRDFFASRALSIKQGVEKSREFHEKILAESGQISEKLKRLDSECASILASVKASGEEESKKIAEQSRIFAQKIHADAQRVAQSEVVRANAELKDLTAKYIAQLAAQTIRNEITSNDEDKLVKRFIDRLQGNA